MKNRFFQHWPTMVLGAAVAAVLLTAVFSYQLSQTECAVVTTFGRPEAVMDSGLHFRWPFPFQKVYKFDRRIRCYDGGIGKLEETTTSDQHNILAGIYVCYRISDPKAFFVSFTTIPNAEEQLNSWMRGFKNSAIGSYRFSQIVNTDAKELKITEIENTIRRNLAECTGRFGMEIVGVGMTTVNVPQSVSEKVFSRMIAERKRIADRNIAEGESEAKRIRIKADTDRTIALAEAEAEAQRIRAAGDAEAAKSYAKFNENPELASYLRQLESLKRTLKGRTTLIMDTDTVPFTLLRPGSDRLNDGKK
ncbi:MAG: protease modulator HflC [Victivallaceae bacterium]|nr:protease modulator HflC [Victivallaceae bacterium]